MAVAPSALADALRDCYQLERELGHGGMATVYLAQDLKHKRPVALKVLLPELAHSLGPDRFHREIEIAARLQHPHILTVLDSGETAGQLWFTMPYVEGESLRTRLTREGQLPVEVALRITCDAAQALQYAHEHGVIHRDIKPENLLLTTDGNTLVADFGIARALGAAGDGLTETGMSIGTPAYMSPEQASAERDLGATTDIYSLGCVLYEMLAGEPPFTGRTPQAILAKRLSGETPKVRVVRPTVPERVEHAVTRALALVPADRFASAADFARALAVSAASAGSGTTVTARAAPLRPARRPPALGVAAALGLILAVGAGLVWSRSHDPGNAGTAGPRRLAVLPFENLGKSEDEYFADGVTDEVRGKLGALPDLAVIARASSSQYRRTAKRPGEIGRELGVQYLLTATVRWDKSGGASRVRVSPELIRVSDAATLWRQPFDAAITDVFAVQEQIAGRVAQALDVALGANAKQVLAEKPTKNLAAYDAFLKGEETFGGALALATDMPTLRRAAAFYDQATALDTTFLVAWTQLSRVRSRIYGGVPAPAEAEAARRAADRALALGPSRAESHVALADYYLAVLSSPARALEEYRRAGTLAAPNAQVLTGTANAEAALGQWDSAVAHLKGAQALDPRSAATARRLGAFLLWMRRYREAQEAIARGLAVAPADLGLLFVGAATHLAQGDLAGARAVLAAAPKQLDPTALVAFIGAAWDLSWMLDDEQQQLLLRLTPGSFDNDRGTWGIVLSETHAFRGDLARCRAYADSARLGYEQQVQAAPEEGQPRANLGLALAYLGNKNRAVQEGERSVALAKDAVSTGYYTYLLVRIYVLVDEPGRALDRLEPLLRKPHFLSPGWLRLDPFFAPLRGHTRFERLAAGR